MMSEFAKRNPSAYEKVRADAKALENTEALLWRVEAQGLPASYLFGTMHLSDERITKLSPTVLKALTSAKTVVLEIGDLSPSALAGAVATSGADLVYADGRSLADALSPDEFEKVKAVVAASGLPGDAARLLKPWLISTLLSISECERRKAASGTKVLDMQLAETAKASGIPVAGLESINEQLTALAGIPEEQQLQMLRVSLKYFDRTNDMMETMVQLYLRRDMGAAMPFQSALANEMGIPDTAFDGFRKSLLDDRNRRMSTAARPFLDKGNAFVAVGALHLPGKTGLVSLLRENGFTVVPVE
jgi:uncharacterized protein YbaP (TraB family)